MMPPPTSVGDTYLSPSFPQRNVLPTLNNLLENREMGLEDGGFIMSHQVFDQLVASGRHTVRPMLAARISHTGGCA